MNNLKLLLFGYFLVVQFSTQACTFNGSEVSAGTLTPTSGYQTVSNVSNGQYFTINVNCGDQYNFTFCSNGGSASWDTQISIVSTSNTQLAYNDDFCSLQSDVTWTSNFTGTVYVLITEYPCNFDGTYTGATLAYNVTAGTPADASFTLSANNCTSASATITGDTGGTFSFNPVPGDGANINSSTGAISNGTAGSTYTVAYTVDCGTSSTQSVTLSSSGDASFSLTEICGGANATITGDTGGTFSFNTPPGDGAQINASTGTITNGSAGGFYFVDYTVCGVTSTESIMVLTDDCWTLNGDAQYITVGGEECVQLTDEINNQTGCAWSGSQIDFNSDFSLSLDYYFGNNIGGADGNTFTFQPSASTACGIAGGQLGAGGLTNALSIEFDTYDNDSPMHVYDMSCDHVAIETDGNHQNTTPVAGPACAKSGGGNIDDGGIYAVEIAWNSTTHQLDVYFAGSWVLGYTDDIVNNVFGGQNLVYWGATSATGGLNNMQYFCPSTVVLLPVEMGRFESFCNGESEVFEWTTITEENTDHFVLEYTYDGMVFYPQEYVDAAGNSNDPIDYTVRVDATDPKTRYYRVKIVDLNKEFTNSEIISSKNCQNNSDVIKSIQDSDSEYKIYLNEKANVSVFNMMGQEIASVQANNNLVSINKSLLSGGIYQVYVVTNSGRKASKKIVVR